MRVTFIRDWFSGGMKQYAAGESHDLNQLDAEMFIRREVAIQDQEKQKRGKRAVQTDNATGQTASDDK